MEIRKAAGTMVQTNNRIGTAVMLADHLLDPRVRRYRQGEQSRRKEWLYNQIGACYFIAHQNFPSWESLSIDTDMLDASMMEDPFISNLTSVEIQYAFRSGVTGVYGEFYGVTPKSLMGFLKSYIGSEKKREAHRLITLRKVQQEKESNDRLFAEIERAKANGEFIPTWGPGHSFKKEDTDSVAHREKIRKQAEDIYKNR